MTPEPKTRPIRYKRFGQLNKRFRLLSRGQVSDFVLRCRVKDSVESQKVKHGY
jgi:hypothetical protein